MTRYELLERIGVGGMAEIFRGKAVAGSGFQKDVAIKRILPHLSQDSRFVGLLITEAKTLSELRHRNIVQIYDVGLNDDGQYFLVMEFVDGLDMAQVFDAYARKRERIPLDVSLYIGAEVCEALEHAHAARDVRGNLVGLVHRDVSPSNILLSRSGEVKLTDFGIAKRTEEMTGHGGVRGKFAYISPEQANNEHVDGRSDVCSLGMVLFEMISGKRLFSALPDFDALKLVRDHQIPELRSVAPDVDASLAAIIMKAVAPDPDDRFQNASELASALRDYRYGMVSTSGDPSRNVAGLIQMLAPVEAVDDDDDDEPDLPELDVGDRTIVRIRSAAGFGAPRFAPSGDGFDDARELFDGFQDAPARPDGGLAAAAAPIDDDDDDDDEQTVAAADHSLIPVRARRAEAPRARGSEASRVDPDADTELAMLDAERDFDAELETKLFDRNDPTIAAAIAGQAARAQRRLPPPSRDLVDAPGEPTIPRADPVGDELSTLTESAAVVSSRSVAAVAPRYPRASPATLRQLEHGDGRLILGMPRRRALWIFGLAGGVLLIIAVALAGSRGGDARSPASDPDGADGGIIEIYDGGVAGADGGA